MNIEQLPKPARDALEDLEQGVLDALNTSKTNHTTATSQSNVPEGWTANEVLDGGLITAPAKPFIAHDEHAITELHWRVHRASEGTLYAIVIHAKCSNEGVWKLRTKLVSVAEHDALVQARRRIDAVVESELRRLTDVPGWEWISFGRNSATLPVKLSRFGQGGRETFEPTANLLAQLSAAEELYRDAGHSLVVAHWALRKEDGLDFREYFV